VLQVNLFKKIVLLFLILCISTIPLVVHAITPLRVAVLPVINTANYRYLDDVQIIQDTIKKPFKYPYYKLVPAETIDQIFQASLAQEKLTDEKAMAALAKKLSVDIVVVAELSKVRINRLYSRWLDDTFIDSDIVLVSYAYSAIDKKYDVIRATKRKRQPESIDTQAPVFFKELTEEILVKLPYKRIPIVSQR